MAVRLHSVAKCLEPGCPWEADGDDADKRADSHSGSRARGAVHHATVVATHPTTRCDQEGCTDDHTL